MAFSLTVYARAFTLSGWVKGDFKVCDSAHGDVADLKDAIARKLGREACDILSLHPVSEFRVLTASAPPVVATLSSLAGDALLTDPTVTSHTLPTGAGDARKLSLVALLSPTEGACGGRGGRLGEAFGRSPFLFPHFRRADCGCGCLRGSGFNCIC